MIARDPVRERHRSKPGTKRQIQTTSLRVLPPLRWRCFGLSLPTRASSPASRELVREMGRGSMCHTFVVDPQLSREIESAQAI